MGSKSCCIRLVWDVVFCIPILALLVLLLFYLFPCAVCIWYIVPLVQRNRQLLRKMPSCKINSALALAMKENIKGEYQQYDRMLCILAKWKKPHKLYEIYWCLLMKMPCLLSKNLTASNLLSIIARWWEFYI